MKHRFVQFSIRFLTAVLAGLFLLLLRAEVQNPVFAVLTPRFASPWELGKLVFWPLLLSALLPLREEEGFSARLPWLSIAPLAAVLVFWGLTAVDPGPGAYLLACIVLLALALALARRGVLSTGNRDLWLVLAVALGVLYVILTFLPPALGPFLDMADVAAMATIPC